MPLYEYECHTCDRTFETLVLGDEPIEECPTCHGHEIERVLSVPARPPQSLEMACDPSAPPCSPMCCRLPNQS